MTEVQKSQYQKKYEVVKAKFDKDMKAFLDAGGVKVKGLVAQRTEKRKEREGDKKKKKDPNAPKKPIGGAFGVFLNENRQKIAKSLPAGHKMTDVTKAAGEQWKKLSDAAKKPYQEKYEQKLEEFKAAMEEYTPPADAEEDGDENDEEEDEEEEEEEVKHKDFCVDSINTNEKD